MEAKLYYTPPSNEIFEEIKAEAIKIWQGYDNEYGYATDKVARIKDIKNIKDNAMYIVAMFDSENQKRLAENLSEIARKEIRNRMIDGGNPEFLIPF